MLTFLESLEDYLGNIGLDNEFELLFVALIIMAGIIIVLNIINAPKIITLLVSLISIFMFITFGWIPQWIAFLIGILLFGFFILNAKGGIANG